jgi:hypothetical protein
MPDYRLVQHQPITLMARRVVVSVSAAGTQPTASVSVVAENLDFPPAHSLGPMRWLLQPVVGPVEATVTLRIEPSAGTVFPSGARFDVLLEFVEDNNAPTRDLIRIAGVDASGLSALAVARMTPVAGGSTATVRIVAPDVQGDVNLELSTTARGAVGACRAIIGSRRAAPEDRCKIRLVVDSSASMTSWTESGLVADVVEYLRGVDVVVGRGDSFEVYLADEELAHITATDPHWGELVTTAARQRGRRIGFRSAWPALRESSDSGTVTFIVTDGPPGDLPDLASSGELNHLIMLCDEPTLEAFGTEMTVPHTCWGTARLDVDDARVSVVIGNVVSGCLKPRHAYGKVN